MQHRRSRSPKKPLRDRFLALFGIRRGGHSAEKKLRRSLRRRLTYIGLAILVLFGALYGVVVLYTHYRFDQIKKVHAKQLVAPAAGKTFTMLMVGSDSRTFVKNATQRQKFGSTTTAGGHRSDVTMVARFDPSTHQVLVLSIPRDLWVHIPPNKTGLTSESRINSAFNAGPTLLIKTIESNLHIPINHYMSVTFTGFSSMVNALGGVTMNFPNPVQDDYSGLHVTKTGCQMVTGTTALSLVRARHLYYETSGSWKYDGLSDFSRIQRQDAFFRALIAKVNRVKLNPLTINKFLSVTVKDLTIDDTFSSSDLVSLAEEFHSMSASHLITETLPTVSFVTTGGADVLRMVEPQDTEIISAFKAFGTGSATTTTTLLPSMINVEVQNGINFEDSYATTAANALSQKGFHIEGVGNATSEGVATTTIAYAPGQKGDAEQVAAAVTGKSVLHLQKTLSSDVVVVTLGSSYLHPTASDTAFIKKIVGKHHRGSLLSKPQAATTTTTKGTTTTTSSSSTTTTTIKSSSTTTTTVVTQSSTTTSSSTSTTIIGTAKATQTGTPATTVPLSTIYLNTTYEPWNPTPCAR